MFRLGLWLGFVALCVAACSGETLEPAGALGDAGGAAGAGGVSEAGSPTVCATSTGPLSTEATPRRTLPWTFVASNRAPDAGAGGAPGPTSGPPDVDASSGDASSPSGCEGVPSFPSTLTCRGGAWLRSTATGPTLTFDDGSQLLWDASGIDTPVAKPYILQADGDRVWVDFEQRWWVVCPYCGAYQTDTIEMRESEGGKVRFIAREGDRLSDLSDAQVTEIFGVTAATRLSCSFHATAGCSEFERSQFDRVLETDPEQVILDATLTRVVSPNGEYDVFWATSSETQITWVPNCQDGPAVASDTGFAASRIAP